MAHEEAIIYSEKKFYYFREFIFNFSLKIVF